MINYNYAKLIDGRPVFAKIPLVCVEPLTVDGVKFDVGTKICTARADINGNPFRAKAVIAHICPYATNANSSDKSCDLLVSGENHDGSMISYRKAAYLGRIHYSQSAEVDAIKESNYISCFFTTTDTTPWSLIGKSAYSGNTLNVEFEPLLRFSPVSVVDLRNLDIITGIKFTDYGVFGIGTIIKIWGLVEV